MRSQSHSKLKNNYISNSVFENSENYINNNNWIIRIFSKNTKPFG